jgi:D-amino peptidase
MKVFITVDMEGISGVVLREQLIVGTPEYAEARHLLIGDANAAVEGALAGGADDIIVADMHSRGFHFPLDKLHPRARYLIGGGHWPRFPFLEGADAMFMVGYHALSGTEGAVRDHTMSSADWQDLWVNGRSFGEVGIDAAIAGTYGVPVMLVTGDDKVCTEARDLLGDIETTAVKQAVARHRALILPPRVAQAAIKQSAERAVQRIGEVEPLRIPEPVEIRLRYTSTDLAERHPFDGERIIRVDGRTVLFKGGDILDALRFVLG